MGNSNSGQHRRHSHNNEPPFPRSRPTPNQYVFAAATPYPAQFPNSNRYYHNFPSFYPPPPVPAPTPYGAFHHVPAAHYPPMMAPYFEHQKAVTIRNDVNVKKESLRVEPDHENPGKFLVSFTFDATAPGRYIFICRLRCQFGLIWLGFFFFLLNDFWFFNVGLFLVYILLLTWVLKSGKGFVATS